VVQEHNRRRLGHDDGPGRPVQDHLAAKLFGQNKLFFSIPDYLKLSVAEQNKVTKIAKQQVASAILLKQLARVSPHVKARNIVVKGL